MKKSNRKSKITPPKKGKLNWKNFEEKPVLHLCFPKFIDPSDENLRKFLKKEILKSSIY